MPISAAVNQAGTAAGRPRKAWILLAVSLGQFLIQLDLTIVNVALPAIGRALGTSVSGLQWVVDGYNLALASLLLVGGRIGDRSGHKRNLPVTAAIGVLVIRTVRETPRAAHGGLDVPGLMLGSAALALLAGGAIEGGKHGFAAALPLALFAFGGVCMVAFLGVEQRQQQPVLPLRFFRSAAYSAANAAGLVMGFVVIGALFLFALYFQQVQGASAIVAGLRFVPLTLAFVLAGPLVGRVIDRTGTGLAMTAGCLLLAAGSLLLLRAGPDSGYGPVWWPFVIIGLGYGLLSTPMAAAVLGAVPRERAGMASSTNLTARLVGGVFGVAVLGALMSAGAVGPAGGAGGAGPGAGADAGAGEALTRGLHAALIAAAAVALAGAVLTGVFLPGRFRPVLRATSAGRAGRRLPARSRPRDPSRARPAARTGIASAAPGGPRASNQTAQEASPPGSPGRTGP